MVRASSLVGCTLSLGCVSKKTFVHLRVPLPLIYISASASIFPLMAMACHHYMIFTLQRVFRQTPRVPTIVVTQNQAAAHSLV
uniref:Uncharacterized protein n=1 Tax=Helianthus annuus TaxID=4232 RepID=A0A251VKW6_HELAN